MVYYKWFLCFLIVGIVVAFAYPHVKAHAEVSQGEWVIVPPPLSIPALISHYSELYGISSSTLYATLKCESKLNPRAMGDFGSSFGVAQIHLPAHPTITVGHALDPDWAINWAAYQFSLGHQRMWSCYNLLY